MPEEQERILKEVAFKLARQRKLKKKKSQTTEEAKNAFVYGTMRKTGWKPSREK